jgi:hypothetical protein
MGLSTTREEVNNQHGARKDNTNILTNGQLTISTTSGEAHGWQHHIGENWHNRATSSGGEYSITTEDGRVTPKHVLIEFEKSTCYINGQKNKYSALNECNRMLKYNIGP